MKMVAIDIMDPFPKNQNGNCYILVAEDYFTKLLEGHGQYQTSKPRQLHKRCWKKCFSIFLYQIDCTQIMGGNLKVSLLKNCASCCRLRRHILPRIIHKEMGWWRGQIGQY